MPNVLALRKSAMAESQTPHLVLARKWRPERFSELVGQEHVTRTLSEFKRQRLLELNGSTLLIKNKAALERLVAA
jgi:replication-associated recombination protein RarA